MVPKLRLYKQRFRSTQCESNKFNV